MADTGDLKSPEGNLMRVRVPPQALILDGEADLSPAQIVLFWC